MSTSPRTARIATLLALLLAVVFSLVSTPPTSAAAPQAAAAAGTTFRNPLNTGPDPYLTYFNGSYYMTTTQGGSIRMWRSASLATLLASDPVTVWTDTDGSRNKNIWASEFYRFGNRWYLYYTADDGVDDHHRVYVLESDADSPTGPYHFKSALIPPNHTDDFAIDPSVFTHNGKLYPWPTAASTPTSTTDSTSPPCRTRTPSPVTPSRSTRRAAARRCARALSSSTATAVPG